MRKSILLILFLYVFLLPLTNCANRDSTVTFIQEAPAVTDVPLTEDQQYYNIIQNTSDVDISDVGTENIKVYNFLFREADEYGRNKSASSCKAFDLDGDGNKEIIATLGYDIAKARLEVLAWNGNEYKRNFISDEFDSGSDEDNIVQFDNKKLEEFIGAILNKKPGELYESDISKITKLGFSHEAVMIYGYDDISEMEKLTNLTELYLIRMILYCD
jgi:hypothetical protein